MPMAAVRRLSRGIWSRPIPMSLRSEWTGRDGSRRRHSDRQRFAARRACCRCPWLQYADYHVGYGPDQYLCRSDRNGLAVTGLDDGTLIANGSLRGERAADAHGCSTPIITWDMVQTNTYVAPIGMDWP